MPGYVELKGELAGVMVCQIGFLDFEVEGSFDGFRGLDNKARRGELGSVFERVKDAVFYVEVFEIEACDD